MGDRDSGGTVDGAALQAAPRANSASNSQSASSRANADASGSVLDAAPRRHRGKRKRRRGSNSGGGGASTQVAGSSSNHNNGGSSTESAGDEHAMPIKKKKSAKGNMEDGDNDDEEEEKQAATLEEDEEAQEGGEGEKQWGCPACTYLNDALRCFCEMCGTTNPTPKRAGGKRGALAGSPGRTAEWSCVACTMKNPPGMRICAICGTINPHAPMQSALTIARRSLTTGLLSEEDEHDEDDSDDESDDDESDESEDGGENSDDGEDMDDTDASERTADATTWVCSICASADRIPVSERTCPECFSARLSKRKSPMKAKRKAKKSPDKKPTKSKQPVKKSAYGVSSDVLRKLAMEPTSSKLIDTLQTLTHTLAMMDASTDSEWGDMRGAAFFMRGFGSVASSKTRDPELLTVLAEVFSQQKQTYSVDVRLLAVQSINYLLKMDRHLFGRTVVLKVVDLYLKDLLRWRAEVASNDGRTTTTPGSDKVRSTQMLVEECLNGMSSVCSFEGYALRELVSGEHFSDYLDFVNSLVEPESGFHSSIIVTSLDLLQKCCMKMRWSGSDSARPRQANHGSKTSSGTQTVPSPEKKKKQDGVMPLELAKKVVALLLVTLSHKHVPLHVKAAKCLLLVFHRIPFQRPEVITELVTPDVLAEFVAVVTNHSGEESEDSRQAMISLLLQLFDNRPQLVSVFVQKKIYVSLFDGMLPLLRSTSSALASSTLKLTALLARLVCRKHSAGSSAAEDTEAPLLGQTSSPQANTSPAGRRNRIRFDSAPDPDVLATLLLDFIRADSIVAVSALLKDGADLNFPRILNIHGQEIDKPLQVAAAHASLAMVRYLVKRGADVHQSGPGGTALHVAAISGRCDVVSFLLQCGASIFAVDRNGKNVLQSIDGADSAASDSTTFPSAVKKMLEFHQKAIQADDESDLSEGENHSSAQARSWFFSGDNDDDEFDEDEDDMEDEDHDDDEEEAYYMDYDDDDDDDDDDDEGEDEMHKDEDEEIPSDEDMCVGNGDVGETETREGEPDQAAVDRRKLLKKRRLESVSSEPEAKVADGDKSAKNEAFGSAAKTTPEGVAGKDVAAPKDDEAALRRQGFAATSEEVYGFSHAILQCLLVVLHDMDIQNVERTVISTLACVLEMAPSQLIRGLSDGDVVLLLDTIHFLLQGQKHEQRGAADKQHAHSKSKNAQESAAHSNSQVKASLSSSILALRILQAVVRKSPAESSIFYQIERRGISEQIKQLYETSSFWLNSTGHRQLSSRRPHDTIFGRGLELLDALRANMIESGMLHLHKLKNLARRMRDVDANSTSQELELAVVDLVELFEHPNSITTYEFKQSELLPAVLQFAAPNNQLDESRVKSLMEAFDRCPEGLKHLVFRLQSIITQEESFPVVTFNAGKGRELYPLTKQLKIAFSRLPRQEKQSAIEDEEKEESDDDETASTKTIHSSPLTHFQSFERTIARCLPVHDVKLSQLYVNLVGHSIQKVIDGKWKKFWVCGYDLKRSFHLLKPIGGIDDDVVEMVLHDSQYKLSGSVDVYNGVTVNLELFGSVVESTPKDSKKKRKANKRKRKLSLSKQQDEEGDSGLCEVEVQNEGELNLGKMKGAWYAGSIVDSSGGGKTKKSAKSAQFESIVKPHEFYTVKVMIGKKIVHKVPASLLRKRLETPQEGSVVEVDGALGQITKVYQEREGVDLVDVKVNRDIEKVRVKKDRIRFPPNAKVSEPEDQIEAMSIRRMFPARESSIIAGSVGDRVWVCPASGSPVKDLYVAGTITSFPSGLESIRESSTVNVAVSFGIDQAPMTVKVNQDRVLNFAHGSRKGSGSRLLAALQMASGRGGQDRLFGGQSGGAIHRAFQQVAGTMRSDMEVGRPSNGDGGSGSAMDQLRQLISRVSRGGSESQDSNTLVNSGTPIPASSAPLPSQTAATATALGDGDAASDVADEIGVPSTSNSRSSSPLSRSRMLQNVQKRGDEESARNDKVWAYLKREDGKPDWSCAGAPKVNLNLGYGGRECGDVQFDGTIGSRIGMESSKSMEVSSANQTEDKSVALLVTRDPETEMFELQPRAKQVFLQIFKTFETTTVSPKKKKRKLSVSLSDDGLGRIPDACWDIEKFCAFLKRGMNWPTKASRSGGDCVEQCILFSKYATAASKRRGLDFDGFVELMTSFCKEAPKAKLVLKYFHSLGYSEASLSAGSVASNERKDPSRGSGDSSLSLPAKAKQSARKQILLREFPADQNVLKCLEVLQEQESEHCTSMRRTQSASLPPWKYLYKVYCDFTVDWTPSSSGSSDAANGVEQGKTHEALQPLRRIRDLVYLAGDQANRVDDFEWLEDAGRTIGSVAGGTSSVSSAVRLLRFLFDFKSDAAVLHDDVWTSPRLYNKLETQLQDVLSVCSGIYPKWCDRMVTQCRFFFPRELREKLFRATSFGCTRSLHWFRNQLQMDESNSSSNGDGGTAGSGGGGIYNQEITITPIPKERVKVHRANILNSAEAVMKMHGKRKAVLDIVFVGEKGYGSGVTAAFYSATAQALQSIEENKKKHLRCWIEGEESSDNRDEVIRHPNGLFPFPHVKPHGKLIERFRMMGRLAGKALMDERILPLPLSTQFMKLVVGESFAIEEIRDIFLSPGKILHSMHVASSRLVRGVANVQIENMDAHEWLDAVSFTFIEPLSQEPLFAGGEDKAVTVENLGEYVECVLNVWLSQGIEAQVLAFREGISEVLPLEKLKLLFVPELLSLLCGDADIKWDAASLLKTMKLAHGYTKDSVPVKYFIEFLDEMTVPQRRAFLLYATGCPNLPPGGFQALKPVFEVVRRVVETDDVDRALPFARTCTNTLHLPAYSSKEVLTRQMRFAIENSRGVIDRD